jgi:hypothetical protein
MEAKVLRAANIPVSAAMFNSLQAMLDTARRWWGATDMIS